MRTTLLDFFVITSIAGAVMAGYAQSSVALVCLGGHVAVIFTAIGFLRSGSLARFAHGWKRCFAYITFAVCVVGLEVFFLMLQFLPSVTM